jgi:hypothetical protein
MYCADRAKALAGTVVIMKQLSLLFVVILSVVHLTVSAQDAEATPKSITPPRNARLQIELSPDGLYVAVLTMDEQGETGVDVWNTDTTNRINLYQDLTMFNGFTWSPNGQYIAVTGNRTNASGHEFALLIFDIFDTSTSLGTDQVFADHDFREFVPYEDPNPRSDYAPVWSADGHIIALNFLDGVHFYDITACDDECKPFYTLDIGYVPWFDWRGNKLITLADGKLQLWDVTANLAAHAG